MRRHSNGKGLGKVFQKETESRNKRAFPGSCVPFYQEPFGSEYLLPTAQFALCKKYCH